VEAAGALAWGGPGDPGDWTAVVRTFRDGHAETWRAADATLGGWGPDGVRRLVVATADPGTLPDKATWYLVTNLPRPGGPREPDSPHPAASLAEIVRLYGIRHWIEVGHRWCRSSHIAFSWLCSLFGGGLLFRLCPAGSGVEAWRACPAFA
jgi:hypothetical protein